MEQKREFKLTTLSLKNSTSVFILSILIIVIGLSSYIGLPKELFPEVNIPYVMVKTIYPGNNPVDIENLISRPIEKEIDGIKGIKHITSTSLQDVSMITIEFNFQTDIKDALQDVKDAVDKAKSNLPNDLKKDPEVNDIDMSEFPFINVNISGDYSLEELKKYADDLEEEFKSIKEVSKVNIQGVSDKEVRIDVDEQKLEAFKMSFQDIENAISQENISLGGGQIKLEGTRRSVRIIGEFENMNQIRNIIVKSNQGNIIYLRDLAEVKYTYAEPKSISRLYKTPVLSLQIVKKSGENILSASKKVYEAIENLRG